MCVHVLLKTEYLYLTIGPGNNSRLIMNLKITECKITRFNINIMDHELTYNPRKKGKVEYTRERGSGSSEHRSYLFLALILFIATMTRETISAEPAMMNGEHSRLDFSKRGGVFSRSSLDFSTSFSSMCSSLVPAS